MPEVNLGKVVGPKGSDGAQGPAGADGLSAYDQAQAGGYSGSELEFNQQLAGLSDGPFVPESDKGAASGVASLDATGKLEETQKPDYTASEVGAVPTTRTVNGKSLSADVVLTGEDIKASASDNTHIGDVVSVLGGATTPQGALANLGAGVRPNLLINPFFEVNQRGQSSYGQGPTVDMWRLGTDGNGKATVANDGIIISGNTGTNCNFEVGIEEVPPGTYTESFLVDDHTKVSQIYANGSGQFNITENLISYTFEVKSELDSVYWGIQKFLSAGDLKIFGAKLEEGSTQTLAYQDEDGAWQLLPQPESDYATQLTKCQRYYLPIDQMEYRAGQVGTNYIGFSVPTPVTMRTNPVLAGTANIKATNGTTQSGFAISFVTRGGIARAYATKKAHGLTDAIIAFESGSALSAEL